MVNQTFHENKNKTKSGNAERQADVRTGFPFGVVKKKRIRTGSGFPVLIVCLLLCSVTRSSGTSSSEAVARAKAYVLSRLDPETGRCKDEYAPSDPRRGGMTALCVYALLTSGCDAKKTPALQTAIRWLLRAKWEGTYAVSLRAAALAAMKDGHILKHLRRDVVWLRKASYRDGAYTSTSANGKDRRPGDPFDNTNSQWAVLGVYSGVERGIDVPGNYWRRVANYWRQQQQSDGGWGYAAELRDGKRFDRPYGSMTAAGVATLSICRNEDSRGSHVEGRTNPPGQALRKGLSWLEENFSVDANPRKNREWYYLWLFQLQRVGETTGRKYIAGVNWHRRAARRLRKLQNPDGSWGYGPRTTQTCLALLFLARSEAPILVNKLQYPGSWNVYPRDAKNLVRRLSYLFERPLGWQVLDITEAAQKDTRQADWADGRIVYISGAESLELTEAQIEQLRRFVWRGGLLFSEAVRGRSDFTHSMQQLAVRLFPDYPLGMLPQDHPIYGLQFNDTQPRDLQAVTNGIRPLLIHSPRDVSRALQLGAGGNRRPTFHLLANLYLYLTEKGAASPRGQATWPRPTKKKPTRFLHLARVKHVGNCDPEPEAFSRLAAELAKYGLELEVTPPRPWNRIEARQYPVAYMTGTTAFTLTPAERLNVKAYLAAGGTLLADAAGSRRDFADAFRREVLVPLGDTRSLPLDAPLLSAGPIRIERFRYRKPATAGMGKTRGPSSRLEAAYRDGRPVVIFSPDDITSGLVGYPLQGLAGFQPGDARALMVNLLLQLSHTGKH